jgi:hypothetical protein
MLMHIVGTKKESFSYFPFGADRDYLATRVHKFFRVVRQQAEVQSVPRKLLCVESPPPGSDRDIARW